MDELLCLDDVPFQCQDCESHFPTQNSLKLHCFVEGHREVRNQIVNVDCDCGKNPVAPHQCNSCKLLAVSVEGRKGAGAAAAAEKLYTQSQLWKCTGCGILWKCTECGILFKGSGMFRKHLPQCNSIEDVLKRMKQEKNADENDSDVKENIPLKEEKADLDIKYPIKQEFGLNIKEEKFDPDVKFPLKQDVLDNIKQENSFSDNKLNIKQEIDGNVKLEVDDKFNIKQEIGGNLKLKVDNKLNVKRDIDGNIKSENGNPISAGSSTRQTRSSRKAAYGNATEY